MDKWITHVDGGSTPVTKPKLMRKKTYAEAVEIPERKENLKAEESKKAEQDEDRIQRIPAEKTCVEAVEIAERKENLKAEETKKAEQDEDRSEGIPAEKIYEEADEIAERKENLKAELSILKAMETIDATKLSIYLSKSAIWCASSPAFQLTGMLDCVGDVLTRVKVPWVKMFEKPSLFEMYNFPLSQIPKPFYDTIVKWIKVYEDDLRGAFVMWGSEFLLEHLVATQEGREGRITCRSKDAIFIVLAILLRWDPDSVFPVLHSPILGQGQEKIPLIVWMIAQVSQICLSLALYSWVNNLLPVAASCNSESRELILQLVEKILSDPDAPNMLLRNRAVPKARLMVPPSEFEMLVRLAFPASRRKDTARFEKIYHSLKEVALPVTKEEIGEIFTLCLKFAGEGNPVLAKEATSTGIWCLGKFFVYCCNHWDNLYEENLEASIALLKVLVKQWKDHSLEPSLLGRKAKKQLTRQIFRFSLKFAEEGDTVLAREATSIAMLCLTESFVDCCNYWDNLYEENLKASVALLRKLVHYYSLEPSLLGRKAKKQVTRQIFRFSLKFAGEGDPVLAKEATSIAILCLTESFVDCCNHWVNLYKENLKASVALLQEMVHKWKDHSLEPSLLGRKANKQVTRQIFRFSLKFAGEGNPVLAREATSIAMLCLTKSFVDCCNHWHKLYKENRKASVALFQMLVHKWKKDHSLKLSSSERKAGEEEKKQVIGHIFRFSLKFAGEGNPVLAREATSIAMLCLTKSFVDCCNHWDKLYEENLKASVALLRKLVHKWKKDHSLKLSSSEMKQVTGQIFRFSLKFAGERDPVLARKATSIAMLCLTESFVDCCNYWDKLYEENLKASVALLQELVHQWKDHSLKLSSSSDTLNRTMESFRLKNKKGIAQGRCNFSLYKEADKLCKMIRCKIIISRGSGKEADKSYKFAFTAVVLALALVLVTVPISVGIWV